ncbi:MAG: hypothetical protein WBL27_09930, partial [Salinimicrobium sp.]
ALANYSEEPVEVDGGDILFKNSQRVFVTEADKAKSVFHSAERKDRKMAISEDSTSPTISASSFDEKRQRFWLKFVSPAGYHRQLLVTRDPETSTGFDLGYDAVLTEDNLEDMYWLINDYEFVIQGVPDFNADRILPVGIKTNEEGEFTIAIDELENIPDDLNIYVRDSLNNTYHNLLEAEFKASAAIGKEHEQYSIVFSIPEEQPNPDEGDGSETGETGDGGKDEGDTGDTGDGTEEGDGGSDGSGSGEDGSGEGEVEEPGSEKGGELVLIYSTSDNSLIIKNPDLLHVEKAILSNGIGQELEQMVLDSSAAKITVPIEVTNTAVYFVRVYYEGKIKSLKFLVE